MIGNILFAFLVVIGVKFSLNIYRYLRTRRLLQQYKSYVVTRDGWESMSQRQPQILALFENAGISDNYLPHIQFVGYGHYSTGNVSVRENLVVVNPKVVRSVVAMFNQAIGTYRSRAFEALNPFYWIEVILMLPRTLLAYVGVPAEGLLVKITQLVYWLLGGVVTMLVSVYRPEIDQAIRAWMASFSP